MVNHESEPVFFTKEYAAQKKMENTSYIFSCQYLLDPKAESHKNFDREWLQFWTGRDWSKLNVYIIVDPANSKTKRGDYTAMIVVGIGSDDNFYVIDIVRDKLSLTEKCDTLMDLHRIYAPDKVYYEEYGMQSDLDHIKYVQEREMYRFKIHPIGGKTKKEERIAKLEPLFRANRIFLPDKIVKSTVKGELSDNTQVFISEYLKYPFGNNDDMLDALSRIEDPQVKMVRPAFFRKKKTPKRAITKYNHRSVYNDSRY